MRIDFNNVENFTHEEEIANYALHGIGLLISIPAAIFLVIAASRYGTPWHTISFSIYGFTLIFLYLASTLYHSARGKLRDIFEIMDHSAVFLLIAGTTTPFALIAVQGILGWIIFGLEWGLTAVGIIFMPFIVKKMVIASTLIYIVMGWLIFIGITKVISVLPLTGLLLLVTGGIVYTGGSVFYMWRKILFHHAFWHFFVLIGSVCHYFCVLIYLLPLRVQ